MGVRCGHRSMGALVLVAGLSLTGCSPSQTGPENAPVQPSAAHSDEIDLARLSQLADDFPPGLKPEPLPGPSKVGAQYEDQVGDTVSYGKPLSVEPPECRALLKPVTARPGAETMGIGAGGPQPPALVVGADAPVEVPTPLPSKGCDRMTFVAEGALPDGSVERLPAPDIEDAIAYGLKVIYDTGVEYFYIAILDGSTYVVVRARMTPDFQPEPLLPDLLKKAVTAI